jgi:opacity protein-like surface antigen
MINTLNFTDQNASKKSKQLRMKKLILLSGVFCCLMGTAFAQSSIEFIPMGGYTFGDKLQFNNSFGQVSTAWNYGGSIQFNLNRHFGIEVMYNRMDVTAKMYNYGAFPGDAPIYQTNAGINYIMVGPNASFPLPNSPVSLFLGASLGAAIFSPSPQDFTSNAKFAYGLQAGANIYITPQFGIRLSGRLLGTAPADGYYFGQWGEPGGGGYYNYNPGLVQFGFNVGFIVGLGRVLPADQQKQRATRHARPPRKYYYYN